MVSKKLKKQHKALKQKRKKLLSELTDQLKKLGERLTLDDLITLSVGFWAAFHTRYPTHALTGMVGYKLARSDNLISGAAGVGVLAALGLVGLGEATEFKLFPQFPGRGLQITGPYAVKVIG